MVPKIPQAIFQPAFTAPRALKKQLTARDAELDRLRSELQSMKVGGLVLAFWHGRAVCVLTLFVP